MTSKSTITTKLLLGLGMAAAATLPLSASNFYTAGHADIFGLGYEGGAFDPHFHYESSAVINGVSGSEGEFEPDEVTTVVPQTTFDYWEGLGGRPADAAWDPLGVAAGVPFYFLPDTDVGGPGSAQSLGAPFAGVGTEELTASEWDGDIGIRLVSVSGPVGGQFSLWTNDTFGDPDTFHFATSNGIDGTDLLSVAAGSHTHYNWGFTLPGTYEVTVEFTGTRASTASEPGPVTPAQATYTFVVPEPSSAALFVGGVLIPLLRRRRAS